MAVKSPGRDWGPAGWLQNPQKESGDQQDSCEVSRKSLDTSRIAVETLERVWGPVE